jgi:hypothetical protein
MNGILQIKLMQEFTQFGHVEVAVQVFQPPATIRMVQELSNPERPAQLSSNA